jgi:hypothetical protein
MQWDKILQPKALDFPKTKLQTIRMQSSRDDTVSIRNARLVSTNEFLTAFQILVNQSVFL